MNTDDGLYHLHLDIVSGQTVKRYSFRFDQAGWDRFRDLVISTGLGIEIARVIPIDSSR